MPKPESKIDCLPSTGGHRLDTQFRALKQAGFHDAVSLETHWKGGETRAISRICWAGMKQALKDSKPFSNTKAFRLLIH